MKIIYLHQYFRTLDMPGGTRSYEMARRFVDWGHEVHIVTSDQRRPIVTRGWRETREAGIHVHWLSVPYTNSMNYAARIRAFLTFASRAAFKAASLDGDVVFATSTPLTIALPAVYAAKRRGLPMVFEVRDLWPDLPIAIGALRSRWMIAAARRLERFAYRNAERIVALSPGMRDGIVRTGYPEDRIVVIPNSADLDLFGVDASAGERFRSERPWLGDRPLVVYTGTLGRINGVAYLVDVAASIRAEAPDVRFLIVGGGAEFDDVKRRARELGVFEDSVFMIDKLPKSEVPAVLSAATMATSLFVDLEEMWANSANKFFDALASSTPVAINYGGWQAKLLEEHRAGIVLDPRNPARAGTQLLDALREPEFLRSAGTNARRLAEEKFGRDDLASQLHDVLQSVCNV